MSWLDDLFGSSASAAPTAPPKPYAPASVQAQTAGFPDQATWLANYIKAQGDLARTRPTSFYNWISGNQGNAAREMAAATGPAEYFKQLSAQPEFNTAEANAENAQIGAVQNQAQAGLVSGQNIDPAHIPAAQAAYTAAMRQQFPDLAPGGDTPPSPQPAAAPAPQGGTPFAPSLQPPVTVAPLPPPQANAGAPGNVPAIMRAANAVQSLAMPQPAPAAAPNAAPAGVPLAAPTAQMTPAVASALQKHRALLDLYARLDLFKGNATGAKALYDEAARGIPVGAAVDGRGNVVEGAQGGSLGGLTGQAFEAKGAGMKATAEQQAREATQKAIDNNKIGGEREARIAETNNEKNQTPLEGYDTTNGQPVVVAQSALKGGVPNFAPGKNPYIDKHAEETKVLNTSADEARDGIIKAQQLVQAAQNLTTGAWGNDIQDIKRGLAQLGIGGDALTNAATSGDIVKELSTELAGLQSRAIAGGRTPLGLFNVVSAVKPSLLSVNPAAVAAPIIAGFQRKVDEANFANEYYSDPKNWNRLDARQAFGLKNPDQKYIDAAKTQGGDAPPPAALKTLKAGAVTTFGNGQKWTLQNGKPVRVK